MSTSPSDMDGTSPEPEMAKIRVNLHSRFLSSMEEIPKDCIQVYARVRPMLPEEEDKGFKECIAAIDEETVRAVVPASSNKGKSNRGSQENIEDFKFTTAFGPDINQFTFFEETMMKTMVNFIEGHNSLVFSYGITGSGKTYTLQGNADNPGIIPISLKLFFSAIEDQVLHKPIVKPDKFSDVVLLTPSERQQEINLKNQVVKLHKMEDTTLYSSNPKKTFAMLLCELFSDKYEAPERQTTLEPGEMMAAQAATQMKELSKQSAAQMEGQCCVWVSFVEIYNENIYDLLQAPSKIGPRIGLTIAEDNGDVFIKGVQQVFVSNSDEALQLLMLGRKNLKIASTRLNYESSRSHCIYTLKVVRIPSEKEIPYASVNWLSFCDLAGSERSGKADTHGKRLKEASCINRSLLVLGRCLELLRTNQTTRDKKMIPFRESKLTRLLSNFFLGKGSAVMISNVSPSEYTFDETLHVLRYSANAKQIYVNDKFIESASSTLQSISDKWAQSKQNVSDISGNSSCMDDSYEELVQEKDEFISKLLALAESLTEKLQKEKQEKAELEYTIRQEVLREYAESCDLYLEKQRETHETEKRAIRESHAQRIAAMEARYDALLQQYEEALNESEIDSHEESKELSEDGNDSRCNENLKAEKKIENIADDSASPDKPKRSTLNPNEKEFMLSADTKSIAPDLEDKNMTMSENTLKRKLAKRAEFQKFICENEDLSKMCSPTTNMCVEVKEDTSVIQSLELKISTLLSEMRQIKDNLKTTEANKSNLEKENNQCKEIISCLEAENSKLASRQVKNESELQKYIEDKNVIQDRLLKTLEELNEIESRNSKLKEELATVEMYKGKAFALKEKYDSLNKEKSFLQDNFSAVSKELAVAKEELESVNSKLAETVTLCKDYKTKFISLKNSNCEMQEKMSSLSSELDCVKEALDSEKLKSKEFSEALKKEKFDFTNLEEMFLSKQKEFIELQEMKQASDENLSILKDKYDRIEEALNLERLKSKELSDSVKKQHHDISVLEEKYLSKEKELSELQKIKQALDKNVSVLEEKLDAARRNLEDDSPIHDNCQQKVTSLKKSCESKDTEIFLLHERIGELESKLATANQKEKELSSAFEERLMLKSSCDLKDEEISELKKCLENLKTDKLSIIPDEAEKEVKMLKSTCSLKDEEISELKKTQENLEVKIAIAHDVSEKQIEMLKSSCSLKDEQISELKKTLDDLDSQVNVANQKLKELFLTHEDTEKKLVLSQACCLAKDKEISELKNAQALILERFELRTSDKIDALTLQYSEEKAKCVQLEEKLLQLEHENQEKQDTLNSMFRLVEILQNCEMTAYCSQEKSRLTTKMLEENISELKRTVKLHKNSIEDLEKDDLDSQVNVANQKLKELFLTHEDTEKKLVLSQACCLAKDKEISELKNAQALILERFELRTSDKIDALTLQYSEEKAKCVQLEEKLLQLEHENQEKQDTLNSMFRLVEILQNCEMTAYCSQEKSRLTTKMLEENISELKRTVKLHKNSIEDLEKALCTAQEEYKDLHKSSQEKLHEKTLELLKLEEENKQLKSNELQYEQIPESSKRVLKERGNHSMETDKKVERKSSKKAAPKKTSSKFPAETNEVESSRAPSLRARGNKISYSEHNDSDFEAFEPPRKVVQKTENYQRPTSSHTRRKIAENAENVSPVQKLTNYVGSRLKTVRTTVAMSMPSPRLTRGRKKLFNTDATH